MAEKVTSAGYRPRAEINIAVAILELQSTAIRTRLRVVTNDDSRYAQVVETPFYDTRKQLTKT